MDVLDGPTVDDHLNVEFSRRLGYEVDVHREKHLEIVGALVVPDREFCGGCESRPVMVHPRVQGVHKALGRRG